MTVLVDPVTLFRTKLMGVHSVSVSSGSIYEGSVSPPNASRARVSSKRGADFSVLNDQANTCGFL